MKVSIVVQSKGCKYLGYLLTGLRDQSVKPSEVVLVVKGCNLRHIEDLCGRNNLPCVVVEQKSGYVTSAMNIGKKEAKGDLIIFTDDDAVHLADATAFSTESLAVSIFGYSSTAKWLYNGGA